MKEVYDITRRLAGKPKVAVRPVKDVDGTVLTNQSDQLKRWAEHFGKLLNRLPLAEPARIEPTGNPLEMDTSKPTRLQRQ